MINPVEKRFCMDDLENYFGHRFKRIEERIKRIEDEESSDSSALKLSLKLLRESLEEMDSLPDEHKPCRRFLDSIEHFLINQGVWSIRRKE